jgi:hypothetical protein
MFVDGAKFSHFLEESSDLKVRDEGQVFNRISVSEPAPEKSFSRLGGPRRLQLAQPAGLTQFRNPKASRGEQANGVLVATDVGSDCE